MSGPKYSAEQKEHFFEFVDPDGTVRAAAQAAGVSEDAAYQWLRQAGLSMQRATPVARELGITRVTCYSWAYSAGIRTSEARKPPDLPRRFTRHGDVGEGVLDVVGHNALSQTVTLL